MGTGGMLWTTGLTCGDTLMPTGEQQLGKVWEQGEYGAAGLPWLEIDSLNNDKYNLLWPY